MAQPARVVRARRARSRTNPVSGKRPDRLPNTIAFPQTERVWNAWLVRLLAALTPQVRGTAQAASAARAVLDGAQLPHYRHPRAIIAPLRALSGPYRLDRLPLRLAAHMVTLSLVLVVAIGVRMPALPLASDRASTLSARVQASAPDLLVQRGIGVALQSHDAMDALPEVRQPDAQLAPAFVESHEVAEGETLGQIAALYHLDVATLFWSNDLDSENVFAAGQELRIPRLIGIPHIIEEGETLAALAARFGVRPQAITLLKANEVAAEQPLPVGREIFIPGGSAQFPDTLLARFGGAAGIAALRAVAAGTVREAETNLRAGPSRDYDKIGVLDAGRRLKLIARHEQWVKVEDAAAQTGWVRSDLLGLSEQQVAGLPETNDFPPPPVRWIWPTHGSITSRFGWRSAPFRSFHDGLDIANSAWTEIYAARSGQVYEAGWCSGFGYCVKIDHGDGITTIYGHLVKKPPVKAGANVDAGDLIGYMGSTFDRSGGGYSTGVHLHFTVKVNGKAVNPMKFLP